MHTEYSLLDSCTKPKEYVDLAVQNGMKALSFSEHGKPMNWTEKYGLCRESGLKYIHSVEIYLTESLTERVRDNYHTVLIARNMDGLRELNEMVSRSCDRDHFYYTNRLSFDEFLGLSDNIITTSACLASPLNKLPPDHPRYEELVGRYDFLEIQAHPHPDQIAFNQRLFELSKRYGKPLIAGTDTHSSTPYKAECRAVLLASKHKSYDDDAFDLTFKTCAEFEEMFRRQEAIPEAAFLEAMENTNELIGLTDEIELDTSIKYPILYGSREADSAKFDETVREGLESKLESGVIPREQEQAFREAIPEEMRVFKKLKMDGFMLSMSELIRWCKSQGMAIGTARGSVGGSRVAYVTDVIDLNPETWHTVFSRFCNEDRQEIGDIDIDCVESDRPAIFKYITDRFGSDKTARVASFGTIKDKGVIDDVGRYLAMKWDEGHPGGRIVEWNEHEGRYCEKQNVNNPWSLSNIAKIKNEYDADPEKTKAKYPELFYYFDGLLETKISQSVHPAGMVISPITLPDNFGVFDKEGEQCLFLDMENIHDWTGLAKYDFLILKTVQVIRDTCNLLGLPYPKTHEVNWEDPDVWADMLKSPCGIFQFEGKYAFDSLKKFRPQNIFDMSLVTACIRPTGASYRDTLLARIPHQNPSPMIDKLLENNLGYLVYQEDTIAFLQQICGLSGSEADNIRRAIGRKQKDRLDKAMPSILEGYCSKSDKPREEAEKEAKEFLQVIEDSASYQFGYNHSIAYCLLGYLCAYYRYYHPLEFVTAFLNDAANDDDIVNGTEYANRVGIRVTSPKWGISLSNYVGDGEQKIIAKGLSSVKYMSDGLAEDLHRIAHERTYDRFVDVLEAADRETSINARQLDILIKLDFFSEFGNQRELLRITDLYDTLFKRGEAKKISRDKVDGTPLEAVVEKYSVGVTKSGGIAKSYTLLDVESLMREAEDAVKAVHMDDLPDSVKAHNFIEIMGYAGYTSGKEEDRRKLFVTDVFPLTRKKDGKQFGYSVLTQSIGSGKAGRFSVMNSVWNKDPLKKGDLIWCAEYVREGAYFRMTRYERIF